MALIHCDQCGRLSSDDTGICNHCNATLSRQKSEKHRGEISEDADDGRLVYAKLSKSSQNMPGDIPRHKKSVFTNTVAIAVFGACVGLAIIIHITLGGSTNFGFFTIESDLQRQLRIEQTALAAVEEKLKWMLRDPDSYVREIGFALEDGNTLKVQIHYRAKNGFGGYTKGEIVAICDKTGETCELVNL